MKLKKTVSLLLASLSISGCVAGAYESESHYSSEQTMTRQDVTRCVVLERRWVKTNAQSIEDRSAQNPKQPLGGPATSTGSAIGGSIGATLAKQISNSSDSAAIVVGAIVGATSGAHLGNNIDNKHSRNTAVEYSIIDVDGKEFVLIQPYNKEDRLVDQGQSCRLVSGGASFRILPADHLSEAVKIPKVTKVE